MTIVWPACRRRPEDRHDFWPLPGIEPCRGLVEDDHPWPHGDDAGYGQALRSPARGTRVGRLPVEERPRGGLHRPGVVDRRGRCSEDRTHLLLDCISKSMVSGFWKTSASVARENRYRFCRGIEAVDEDTSRGWAEQPVEVLDERRLS